MGKNKQTRQIIVIDEGKCDGCGLCADACHEGAIAIIDGKAKLVSESYCDGLGDCIGECPRGAITFETREAEAYDEEAVKRHMATKDPLPCGCPGPATRPSGSRPSLLRNWPTQLKLVPLNAPYLEGANLVLASDCSPFAFASFHETFLAGENKVLLNACPKLDDSDFYRLKLTQMIEAARPRSIQVIRMEVPCCGGLTGIVEDAVAVARQDITVRITTLSVEGQILDDESVKHHFS
jgi:ferredoxin